MGSAKKGMMTEWPNTLQQEKKGTERYGRYTLRTPPCTEVTRTPVITVDESGTEEGEKKKRLTYKKKKKKKKKKFMDLMIASTYRQTKKNTEKEANEERLKRVDPEKPKRTGKIKHQRSLIHPPPNTTMKKINDRYQGRK